MIKLSFIFIISAATAVVYKEKKIMLLFLLLAFSVQSQLFDQLPEKDSNFDVSRDTSRKIAATVYENTGWDLTEAKQRVIYFPLGGDKALSTVYSEIIKDHVADKDQNATGYIIARLIDSSPGQNYDWLNWVKQGQIKITKEDTVEDFKLLKFEKIDQNFPSKAQNLGESYPRWNDNYSQQLQSFKKFEVPTYNSKGPTIGIYLDEISKEIIFYSHELAVSHSMGASLYLNQPVFTFFCDSQLKSIPMQDIGFPPGRGYYAKSEISLLAPMWYSVAECSEVRPVKFTAKKITLMSRRAGSSIQQKRNPVTDFEYTFL